MRETTKNDDTLYKGVPLSFFKDVFIYHPSSGDLIWAEGRKNAGKKAGSFTEANGGYLQLSIHYKGKTSCFQGHRIIWALYYNEFPDNNLVIDHIDGQPSNNSIENLRLVTQGENSRNAKPRTKKVNADYVLTAVRGIKLDKKTLEYVASYNGEKPEERFDDYDSAKYARWEWEYNKGYHVNHGLNEDI